jgi:uncharacterized integral membrane protein
MKTIANLLISLIISFWLILIAVFSIQNITPVSLHFLGFKSIKIPVGVLLSMFIAIGIILGSFIPLLFARNTRKSSAKPQSQPRYNRRDLQEEEDPLFNW